MADTRLDRAADVLRAHLTAMQAELTDSMAILIDLAGDPAVAPMIEKVKGQASAVKAALDSYAELVGPALEGHGDGEASVWKK
jgi:hypothetical protein